MTIEQTVDIPASHQLVIDVPREVPAGRTVLAFTPAAREWADNARSIDEITAELRELCKGSALTVDRFLEMRREDAALEEAKYRHMFHRDGGGD